MHATAFVGGSGVGAARSRGVAQVSRRRRPSTWPSRRGVAAPLTMKRTADITDEQFDDVVLGADKAVLVDFYAHGCGPCKLVSPLVEWAGAEYADRLVVAKLDTDKYTAAVARYDVSALPHLVLFRDGQPVEHLTGLVKKSELQQFLDRHLGAPAK